LGLYSDILDNFLKTFQRLTKNFKKIFRYLQRLAFEFKNVFPSIPTIAKKSGCSLSTVKRAIQYFKSFGFINVQKVAYQSNYYYMNAALIKIDTRNPNTYRNAPQSPHEPQVELCVELCVDPVLTSTKINKDKDTSTPKEKDQSTPVPVSINKNQQENKQEKNKQQQNKQENKQQNMPIKKCVKLQGLTEQQQQDLSDRFSEYALVNALQDAKWYVKQGKVIISLVKMLWSRAASYS